MSLLWLKTDRSQCLLFNLVDFFTLSCTWRCHNFNCWDYFVVRMNLRDLSLLVLLLFNCINLLLKYFVIEMPLQSLAFFRTNCNPVFAEVCKNARTSNFSVVTDKPVDCIRVTKSSSSNLTFCNISLNRREQWFAVRKYNLFITWFQREIRALTNWTIDIHVFLHSQPLRLNIKLLSRSNHIWWPLIWDLVLQIKPLGRFESLVVKFGNIKH